MAQAHARESDVLDAYESLAPFYDEFTQSYAHGEWVDRLEALALEHGARGRLVLDVAGGTGKSALPLQRRGYRVSVCDLSPTMIAVARRRLCLPPHRCFVADMRRLPDVGPFDLVFCLDDSLNYLLSPADVRAALRAMRAALRPGGLLLFDVNTLATYSTVFSQEFWRHGRAASFHWRGRGPDLGRRTYSAEIEVVREGRRRIRSVHVQRHYSGTAIGCALDAAGLEPVRTLGQVSGGRLTDPPDEDDHGKLVYVVRRPEQGR